MHFCDREERNNRDTSGAVTWCIRADGQTVIKDGDTPVGIDAGFEFAPGDASDIEVANAHAWGSGALVFRHCG
jgi:hypothetical protein